MNVASTERDKMGALIWKQIPRAPASKQRDPIQGEFFNAESITSLAAQITREGIGQNPLDAGVTSPVHVRISVSGAAGALAPSEAAEYFEGLQPHVEASASDRDRDRVRRLFKEPCQFLTIEDFNTTGLVGDPSATDLSEEGEQNDFFYFFRAEGKSGKSGSDRGRWGVGKYVFPMASRINSFFGLTVRDGGAGLGGPGPLLIGQAVLKNHKIGDQSYEPDGWWSEWDDEVPIPIADPETIETFRRVWNVSRSDEPGLSVIVPYVGEDLGPEHIAEAVLFEYYFAVLRDKLEVEIASPDLEEDIVISQSTLDEALQHIQDVDRRSELERKIELAVWHATLPEDEYIHASRIDTGHPRWSREVIPERDREKIRDRLEAGERVAVRVPVHVALQDGDGDGTWSYFDVVLVHESGHNAKPEFVREGLIVSEVSSGRPSNIRCFVTVDDDELARMVGDAEGPAHTNWSPRTPLFSGKYRYGMNWLALIKRAPIEILRIVRQEDEEEDRRILARFFPMPTPEPAAPELGPAKPDPGPGPTPPGPTPQPSTRPKRIRIDAIRQGFSVHLTDAGQDVKKLRVRVAYDRRRGNPFKNWREDDFRLDHDPISLEIDGGQADIDGNEVRLAIDDPASFVLRVRGFDERRDLRVIADPEE